MDVPRILPRKARADVVVDHDPAFLQMPRPPDGGQALVVNDVAPRLIAALTPRRRYQVLQKQGLDVLGPAVQDEHPVMDAAGRDGSCDGADQEPFKDDIDHPSAFVWASSDKALVLGGLGVTEQLRGRMGEDRRRLRRCQAVIEVALDRVEAVLQRTDTDVIGAVLLAIDVTGAFAEAEVQTLRWLHVLRIGERSRLHAPGDLIETKSWMDGAELRRDGFQVFAT